MTFDEMTAALEALFDEGEIAIARAEKLLPQVPEDDIIVDELWGSFMAAGDEYTTARTNPREELDKIVAAATKVRDATLAWARYIEVVVASPDRSVTGDVNAVLEGLAKKGWLEDSGRRRKNSAGEDEIVWVQVPFKQG